MNINHYLLTALLGCFITTPSNAQNDSTLLNAGRLQLNKNFTQTISIKGEDLEKMPFFSLHDAINVWLYGIYTSKSYLVYVIDGVVANDVNAYSIYDIESITLVQNALSQLNGAFGQQQLLLITTRRQKAGSKGITAAGNTAYNTNKHLYHQYYLGAYNNTQKIRYGISANYAHDGIGKDYISANYKMTYNNPPNFDRFRINGYAGIAFGKHHDLSVAVNYAPQNYTNNATQINQYPAGSDTNIAKYHADEYTFNANLAFKSTFGKRWHNDFTATYLLGNLTSNAITNSTNSTIKIDLLQHGTTDFRTLQFRDNISYQAQAGNWSIVPSLNAQFSFPKYSKYDRAHTYINQVNQSWVSSKVEGKAKSYLLTPSLSIAYKSIVQVQGGILADISPAEGRDMTRLFPFGTITTDVIKIFRSTHKASLQLFGSFACYDNFSDLQYKFTDFTQDLYYYNPTSTAFLPNPPPISSIKDDRQYRIWSAGLRFTTANQRFAFSYNFEKRDYTTDVILEIPGGTGYSYVLTNPDIRAYTHTFGIRATVIQSGNFNWRTGLQATSIANTINQNLGFTSYANIIGNVKADRTAWAGGFTNRLNYKQFFAGADIQYIFNQGRKMDNTAKMQVLFQQLYAGAQIPCKKLRGFELYANCRNLGKIKYSKMPELNKYYGIGFKTIL